MKIKAQNKSLKARALGVLLAAVGVAAVFVPRAEAQVNTVRYSSWVPGNHWLNTQGMLLWAADVEKATQGRVKVDMLPKTVGTPPSQFDVVSDGLADLSIIVAGYTPGRFELAEMGELPFLGEGPSTMSPAFDRIYRKHLTAANEFKGAEVLSVFTIAPGHIFTAKKPVKTIDDLKGMKLRSPSSTSTKVLNMLGAVPILKSSTEAYELISTGVIDGTLALQETVKSANLVGLLHHGTLVPGGLFNAVLAIVINTDKWKSISAADQKAIMGVSADSAAKKFGIAYEAADQAGIDAMKEAKYINEYASPALLADLKKSLKPIEDEWIAKAKKKGIADPAAILAEFRAEAAKGRK